MTLSSESAVRRLCVLRREVTVVSELDLDTDYGHLPARALPGTRLRDAGPLDGGLPGDLFRILQEAHNLPV